MFVKGNKRLQTIQNCFFFVNSDFLTRRIFAQKSKSEFRKKKMKANVCKNSTGHQVNKTKYFCLPLFKILEMEDLWYSRLVMILRYI